MVMVIAGRRPFAVQVSSKVITYVRPVGVVDRDHQPGRGGGGGAPRPPPHRANALVSADASTHDPALLLVEALDAMISATGGDVCTSNITIAVPAYWGSEALRALQDALRTDPGFARSDIAPRLVSDAVTALTALNSDARLPAAGVVGLVDFGGGGTSITLADAASGFTPIADTIRYPQFSGDLIDQALLFHVLDGIGHTNAADPASTAVVGRLAHLSEECRRVKERLSDETVTELIAELPGQRARVQVSRAELENLIEDRLNGVFSAFDDMLRRNGVHRRDLAAVAMVGGGARIPVVAQRLSSHAKASVVTAVQPVLAMAVGAAMLAARRPADQQEQEFDAPTAVAAMAGAATSSFAASTGSFSAPTGTLSAPTRRLGVTNGDAFVDEDPSETLRGLAWSQADDADKEPVLYTGEPYDDDARATPSQYLPTIEPPEEPQRRYRLPQLIFGITAVVSMIAIGGVAFMLTSRTDQQAPPAPTITTAVPPLPPASSMPPSPSPLPPAPSAAPSLSVAPPPPPPPPPVTTTYQPPPTTTQQATTTTTTTATTTTTSTTPPPSSTTMTTTVPMTTEYLRVPFVPVPIPVQVPEGQGSANQPQNPYPFLSPGG
jgi:actin-like ATPase involved in cell morphogenesis